jgi:hypothetical protein
MEPTVPWSSDRVGHQHGMRPLRVASEGASGVGQRYNWDMAATYTVERTRTLDAPPERVRGLIEDFHEWPRWSPWEEIDPAMQRTYGGPASGVGSTYAWSGNRKAGRGRMELRSVTDERVDVALHFDKPFRSDNDIAFLLVPSEAGTNVTWRMTGAKPLAMRLAGPLLNMDKIVGKDFDRGLDRLAVAAKQA